MPKLLGIDVGTGGTRAVLIDDKGRVIASRTAEHQPFASPKTGWAEQDPHDWWRACGESVRAVLVESGVTNSEIAAVGFSGQMHGAVLLDENNQVLRPSLIWCDQRTAEEARELTEQIGEKQLIEWTCNPALTNFTLTKLMWVRKHEPKLYERFRRLQLPKDYVRLRLTGEFAMDMADGSGTLLLDVARRRWSSEMANATGIDLKALPPLFESCDVCGVVSKEGAAATGLAAGTPVVAGAGDQAAGAVGLGVVSAGAVHATIGTSGVVFASTDRPAMDPLGRLHTFCHAVPGRWHVMGVTQAAGLSLRWFRDNFGTRVEDRRDPYDRLMDEAASAPPGCDGVLWAPYLMGERTPHVDPNARAALVGLAANHGRAHILRAILEGVAFSLRDSLSIFAEMGVPVSSIRLGGGGQRSPLWRQIQADVYKHKVETILVDEGAAHGAALLAGVGAKVWPTVDAACAETVQVGETIAPDLTNSAVLQQQYERYRRIYPALRSIGMAATSTVA
ncbi:xylulokinase [Candidatus Koribacter versatilis Ellin345]|uniref:Xylulose kinase n=1 Tax=Koribacter versatilis (strain Ellin345) TaxID=204669 RepID=Q1IT93_KORVE|nr:xylulokinase [Candidatus Koribacter versatilis]ABF39907.1 xylulokinase [Candidatus Koribacter versatilis Ellin345]